LYKKCAHQMLVKLTPILQTADDLMPKRKLSESSLGSGLESIL
jgi:hypothetical protein